MVTSSNARDDLSVQNLVRPDAVHSSVYTSEDVFELELERIFHTVWVYVAHVSEVPTAGDYVTKWIGRQPVIVSRDGEGEVHVLFNRCRHRGNLVCAAAQGNASSFRCAYHGWTYHNDGRLIGVPYPSRYGPDFDKSRLGLTPVPRVAVYRGLVFASLASAGPTLAEHLGGAREVIDEFADSSPEGEILLETGSHVTFFRGNWKFIGMDGYHVNFTHKTVLDLDRSKHPGKVVGTLNTDRAPHMSIDFGNGHCQLVFVHPEDEKDDELTSAYRGDGAETEHDRAYRELLEQVRGPERAHQLLLSARDPHLHIWPNLQLISGGIRVVRPLGARRTEVISYTATLKGAPAAYNEQRVRASEWFHGPAGVGQPDDYEIFERNDTGLQATGNPWLYIGRGYGMETVGPDGRLIGQVTDEVPQRAHMKAWAAAMAGPKEPTPQASALPAPTTQVRGPVAVEST